MELNSLPNLTRVVFSSRKELLFSVTQGAVLSVRLSSSLLNSSQDGPLSSAYGSQGSLSLLLQLLTPSHRCVPQIYKTTLSRLLQQRVHALVPLFSII